MFGVELDGIKKMEVAFVGLILLIGGYFVARNWEFWSGNSVDTTITSWIEEHQRPTDPSLPVGPDNPYNPKNHEIATIFANHDGKLQLIDYPEDSDRGMTVRYLPDRRGQDVSAWRAQWALLSDVSDRTVRLLAINGYHYIDRRISGTLLYADLTYPQQQIEQKAIKVMQTELAQIDDGMTGGAFEHNAFEKVRVALEAYRKNDKDLTTDDGKKKLASRVMDAGLQYIAKAEKARRAAILKYAEAVNQSLTPAQRQDVADAATHLFEGVKDAPKRSF